MAGGVLPLSLRIASINPMKTHPTPRSSRLVLPVTLFLLAACATVPALSEVTPDGLTQVKKAKADLVYVRSGVSFAGYNKVVLLEPTVAFRKNWQAESSSKAVNRPVTDADMAKMIDTGKKMLTEEFSRRLTKAGYTLVTVAGPDVLAIKSAILELDINAPVPESERGSTNKVYADRTGEATLVVELYDSVTGQLLARAYDQTAGDYESFRRNTERTRNTNIQDAEYVMNDWSKKLVKGLERAKEGKIP